MKRNSYRGLYVYIGIFMSVCIHICGFASEREKSVAGDLDSAWN